LKRLPALAEPDAGGYAERPPSSGKKLFVVGGGGHAKVVIDVARSAGWVVVAAFDPQSRIAILGVPVLGSDDAIAGFIRDTGVRNAVIAIGDNRLRRQLAEKVRSLGCTTPAIVHERAWISSTAEIALGVVVMAGAVVNADARVGEDTIINTMAVIEHDCVLGLAVHAAPRSVMGGTCTFGDGTLFGIGATSRPGIKIGRYAVIGAGSVVVSNIRSGVTVAGNPAKELVQKLPVENKNL
jgi:UDP-perosamine 4-acetyltransferase